MNLRTILLIVVALGAAGFTAYFAQNWLIAQRDAFNSQAAKEPVEVIPTDEILVAKENLPIGSFVNADDLTWQTWPKEGIKEEYVVKGIGSEQDLVGAVVRTHLLAGEPITAARVIHPGDRGFLAAVLEEGKRAVSVPVDATTGISGFVFPGDWVDVLLTFRTSVKSEGEEEASTETRFFSETLLTEVRILAIDQSVESVDGTAQVAKTATLEVSAKQAEKIAIAMSIGSLSLSLRSMVREQQPDAGMVELAGGPLGDDVTEGNSNEGSAPASETAQEDDRSYTRDIDIYYMRGDPLAMPTSVAPSTVTVLRGAETGEVEF